MATAFLESYLTYVLIGLVGFSATLSRFSDRVRLMGTPAMLGAGMFVVSTVLMNMWRWGNGLETQVALWRTGLVVDMALYFLIAEYMRQGRPLLSRNGTLVSLFFLGWFVAGAAYILTIALPDAYSDLALAKLSEIFIIFIIAVFAWRCFFYLNKDDLVGILFWGLLAIGETLAIAQTVDCQLLHGRIPIREEGSACAQVYGFDFAVYSTAPLALLFLYVVFKWFYPRKP